MRHERPFSTRDLGREHRRLRRAFTALVVALAPAALAQACSTGAPQSRGASTGGGGGGGADTEAGTEAAAEAQAEAQADAELLGGDAPLGADAGDATPQDAGATDSCATVSSEADAAADGAMLCFYALPCGFPASLTAIGCDVYLLADDAALPFGCSLMEGQGCAADAYAPGPGGAVTLSCPGCLGGSGGRRPRGLVRPRAPCAPTAVGAYFARMAHDEAASVHAFRRLGDELAQHGAPPALVLAAARSARDEERHARVMARYARGHGAAVPAPRVRGGRPRALEAIARENAVEGCVLETFAALIARWQSAHAPDAVVRRTFARIATDETRHAALSWAVARWAEGRLDAPARARIARARARALRALRRDTRGAPYDAGVGRPAPGARALLLDAMSLTLGLP